MPNSRRPGRSRRSAQPTCDRASKHGSGRERSRRQALAMVTAWVMSADASPPRTRWAATHTHLPPARSSQGSFPSPRPKTRSKTGEAPASGEESFDSDRRSACGAKVIAEGLQFTEGPVWTRHDNPPGFLLFSDIPADTIYKLDVSKITAQPDDTPAEREREPPNPRSSAPQGSQRPDARPEDAWSSQHVRQGRPPRTERQARRLDRARREVRGQDVQLPNDLIVAPDGSVYFTDPPYGAPAAGPRRPHANSTSPASTA